jgi:hypothetical protein
MAIYGKEFKHYDNERSLAAKKRHLAQIVAIKYVTSIRVLKVGDFITKCPACGGRRRSDAGHCAYCGNPTKLSLNEIKTDEEPRMDIDPQLATRIKVETEVLAREKKIEFLEKQFEETGHRSIPQKIQNLQKEIAQLTRSEGES